MARVFIRDPNMVAAIRVALSAKAIQSTESDQRATTDDNRRAVAALCRTLGPQRKPIASPPTPKLSPRLRQTLQRLLAGDSEKQVANNLHLSPHTVHVYVKALYKAFQVSSRGELLSQFVHDPTC